MKKQLFVLAASLMLLTGCVSNTAAGTDFGVIECASLIVDGNTYQYTETKVAVSEFKAEDNSVIYTSLTSGTFTMYDDAKHENFTTYAYSSLLGYMTLEGHVFLNLSSKTIDIEYRFVEYKPFVSSTSSSASSASSEIDHSAAYAAAKKGYYYAINSGDKVTTNKSLSRHTYIMLGADASVVYTTKNW